MKCQHAQSLIDDYLDELLSPTENEALKSHCHWCSECAASLAKAKQIRQLLKNAPLPPPSAGFVDRALRNAARQGGPAHSLQQQKYHRQGFVKGFGSAMAAGVALWAVVSLYPTQQHSRLKSHQPPQQSLAQTPVATQIQQQGNNALDIFLYESTNITLAFHAAKAVQGATIRISLSNNLELVGYQNQQTLEWQTDLSAGDNVLTLPIKALSPEQGKIIAQVTHKNLMKSIELQLNVRKDASLDKPVSTTV